MNKTDKISAKQVETYLKEHPDFLTQHQSLLDFLTPPMRWSGDKVVDLQSYMLDKLRDEQDDLKDAARAHSDLENRKTTGSIILKP